MTGLRMRALASLIAAAALAGCPASEEVSAPAESPATAISGEVFERPPPRARVVSLDPLATRFLVHLGAAAQLVGVDRASAASPGVPDVPEVDLVGAAALAPDLVLVRTLPAPDDARLGALTAAGAELVEFEPHDLEDVTSLHRTLGGRLVGEVRALQREVAISRPLAVIGGASFGVRRPRVAAITGSDPLELAGGHSFETDLIEIAGGTSVTHAGETPRVAFTPQALAGLDPELVLVVTPEPVSEVMRRQVQEGVAPGLPVVFLSVSTRDFWLGDPAAVARRFREVIEPLSR